MAIHTVAIYEQKDVNARLLSIIVSAGAPRPAPPVPDHACRCAHTAASNSAATSHAITVWRRVQEAHLDCDIGVASPVHVPVSHSCIGRRYRELRSAGATAWR